MTTSEEQRQDEARKARHRADAERRAVESDRQWRAQLPAGIPAEAVPAGMTAAELMTSNDPMGRSPRRESVLDHALGGGGIVFHPLDPDGDAA